MLAARLAKGDTGALEQIIEMYSGYVRTVAYNFSRGALSGEDIDELAADAFYKLWCRRDSVDASSGLRAYLSVIVRNAVKDRLRKLPPPFEDIDELEPASGFLVEESAELNETVKQLADAMKLLTKEEREIFFRFYFYGEKISEITKATGLTESAVGTKLHRTRSKLKKYLSERGFQYV